MTLYRMQGLGSGSSGSRTWRWKPPACTGKPVYYALEDDFELLLGGAYLGQ